MTMTKIQSSKENTTEAIKTHIKSLANAHDESLNEYLNVQTISTEYAKRKWLSMNDNEQ